MIFIKNDIMVKNINIFKLPNNKLYYLLKIYKLKNNF